ncbi:MULTISPECIES: T9SS type A sorting domain-containing protein [Chitinophagaceae]
MKKMLLSTCLAIVAGIGITNAQINITNSGTKADNGAWTYQFISNSVGIRDFSPGRTDNASYFAQSKQDYQPFLISPRIDDASGTAPTFHVSFWIRDTGSGGNNTWDAPLAVMVFSDVNGTFKNGPSYLNQYPMNANGYQSQVTTASNSSTPRLYDSTHGAPLPGSSFQLGDLQWHHITADITPSTVAPDYYIAFSDGVSPSGHELQWDDFNISSTSAGTTITPNTLENDCTDQSAQYPVVANGIYVSSALSGNAVYGSSVTLQEPNCAPSITGGNSGGVGEGVPFLVPSSGSGDTGSVTFTFGQPVNNIIVKFTNADSVAGVGAEHLTFTTNAGIVTVLGSTCNETQSGNTFSANNGAQTAGGIVTVSSTQPYTTLTVTNVANPSLNGTGVVLCANSVVPATQLSASSCNANTITAGNNVTFNGVTVTNSISDNAIEFGSYHDFTMSQGPYYTNIPTPYLTDPCGDTVAIIVDTTGMVFLNPDWAGVNKNDGSVTYNFSQPVNDIVVVANGMGSGNLPPEAISYATNAGTVTASANLACFMQQSGTNTWTANGGNTNGTLVVTVHSSEPYTSLTVSDSGALSNNGALVWLCANSIVGASILPVGYAQQLTASLQGSSVQLNWSTATEINNKGFHVERSADGKTFTDIGFVASQAANGTGTKTLSYTYTDAFPLQGKNYYRLGQEDLDGKSTPSGIVSTDVSGADGGLNVYPNPAKGTITVSGLQAGSNVAIYSANGQVVKQFTAATSASQQVDIGSLAAGIYFLTTQSRNGQKATVKFIVR